MKRLILGILMLQRLTVYEIRGIIRQNFKDMCSDSLGSIQVAVKKLAEEQMIICMEYVEKGVNKKRYSITEKGRDELMGWLHVPADLTAGTNMEMGKFLFMGLVPAKKRLELIDGIITNLDKELKSLQAIWDRIQSKGIEKTKAEAAIHWQDDPEYRDAILKVTQADNIAKSIEDIGNFQLYSLKLGLDGLNFHVEWFRAFRKKIEDEL